MRLNLKGNYGGKMTVAIIHPNIMVAGGAEVTGLMTLEYFQDKGSSIDFITDNKVDFSVLNEKFSTHISQGKIRIVRPYLCRLIGKLEPRIHLFAKLQLTLFSRYVKKHKDEYELIISTKQEADFGKPGIQFLHHLPDGHPTKVYDRVYLHLLSLLGRRNRGISKNVTISPSKYIKRFYDKIYGDEWSYVLQPAIRKCKDAVEWEKRENGVVIVGHIDKLKETHKAIEIIDKLHKETGLHLHIIGTGNGRYYEMVKQMAKDRYYVELDGFVSTETYFRILTTHKYGLHMRRNEPSAVTVRELIDCGVIPFVQNSGGNPEIVEYDNHLLFEHEPDAEYKMLRMIQDANRQKEVLEKLSKIKFNTRADWKVEFEKIMQR
jgi:hypothetical protein